MTLSTAPSSSPRLFALVPCAGIGVRAAQGGRKQYAKIAGQAVVWHTVQALSRVARLARVMVVLSPGDDRFDSAVPNFDGWVARVGGASRAETVGNGVRALSLQGASDDDWVLVHDAARCLVKPETIDALIDDCVNDSVGGLLALPVSDTLKQEDENGRAAANIERDGKWQAQTPQMFRLGLLRDALAAAGSRVTDEASAIQAAGHAPKLVRGTLDNFKLTFPADFALAEDVLRGRLA